MASQNEVESLFNDEKENLPIVSQFDRFIAVRNNSFEQEVVNMKLMDNTLSEETSNQEKDKTTKSKYKNLLVQQLYGDTQYLKLNKNMSSKVKIENDETLNASVEASSSEAELVNIINSKQAVGIEDLRGMPGKLLQFHKSNTVQMENKHFGLVSNSDIVKQIFSVKRCISLQKSKAEERANVSPHFKPRTRGRAYQLPEGPFKILAAPDIRNDIYQNVIDWAPQSVIDGSKG